jgi:hypothetical protein
MLGIVGIVALLTVLGLSLVVTRLATEALVLTGLSRDAARFQARSAFTGTGFTTQEAEKVVEHPVRRRIIMLLMIVRSAGLLTIVLSLILSFVDTSGESNRVFRLLWIVGGVAILGLLAKSTLVERWLSRVMQWALQRWTDLDTRDYAGLLKLSGEYSIMEVKVRENDWLAGKDLCSCRLAQEGVIVLGIYRNDGSYVGAPKADTKIYAGDRLLFYGRARGLRELDRRRADTSGDEAHEQAVREQERHLEDQERQERDYSRKREARNSEVGEDTCSGG